MSSAEPASVGSPDGPSVNATDQTERADIDLDRWARVAADTLLAEGVGRGHLDLTFVDPDDMAELNRTHMGHDGPTDVLSFPLDVPDVPDGLDGFDGPHGLDGADDEGVTDGGTLPLLLGDVVVCAEVAESQAPEHCGDLDSELTLLVVHGVLHVLGHDHAEPGEAAVMLDREAAHLDRYGMTHPGPVPPDPAPR